MHFYKAINPCLTAGRLEPYIMKRAENKHSEVVVLVVHNQKVDRQVNTTFEVGSYVVNRCHPPSSRKLVDTLITNEADHFLYHMPFCYRLN